MSDSARRVAESIGFNGKIENCSQVMSGAQLIYAERQRQIEKEGWTSNHDDGHSSGELALMGAAYALSTYSFARLEGAVVREVEAYFGDNDWFKTGDPIRSLVKAGALIAAEIDRIGRMQPESK